MVARQIVNGRLNRAEDVAGGVIGGFVRVVGDVAGVEDEIGLERQMVQLVDERSRADQRGVRRFVIVVVRVGADVGVADVDEAQQDLGHGDSST